MLPALACDFEPDLETAYAAYLVAIGRRNRSYVSAARRFLAAWPDPELFAVEPLPIRLGLGPDTRPFVTYLMLHGHLRPGYDYLVHRKIPGLLDAAAHSPLSVDLERCGAAAAGLGYSPLMSRRLTDRVGARLLIQTGKPLAGLDAADLADLEKAFQGRAQTRGGDWGNDRTVLHAARTVLYHLGNLDLPPSRSRLSAGYEGRFNGVSEPFQQSFLAYLQRLRATHATSTISGAASQLAQFGRHLNTVDPTLTSLAGLDRCRHIETWLAALPDTRRQVDGGPLSVVDRRNRILTVARFLADITDWNWPDAPPRRLFHSRDVPRRPQALPRYLPPDTDRRLSAALEAAPNRLLADALLLARGTGLRIGELVDLELDCVHEVPGAGAWLKVPLGKLATERMVPLDDETLAVADRIATTRSHGRPLPHPRSGRLVEFLLTHQGRRVSVHILRAELARAAQATGLDHITPHQLRHTYATALVNAGVSLQSLMHLLGHTSATMSLRYGRLFDATVRADYERALAQAKERFGPLTPAPTPDTVTTDWRAAPAIKTRLAGGFCLRAPAQGSCPYANICEHCPNFRTDPAFRTVLTAQRADAEALAADAVARGWNDDAARHRQLINRLDTLLAQAQ